MMMMDSVYSSLALHFHLANYYERGLTMDTSTGKMMMEDFADLVLMIKVDDRLMNRDNGADRPII